MPSTRETISRTQHGDCSQVTTMDCEEGSLRVVIEGPAGSSSAATVRKMGRTTDVAMVMRCIGPTSD